MVPLFFPDSLHGDEILSLIICAESAAAFDLLTRSSADDEMIQQNKDRWPNTFRAARFVPAVEYLNACRLRYQIMKKIYISIISIMLVSATGCKKFIDVNHNPNQPVSVSEGLILAPAELAISSNLYAGSGA